MKINVLDLLVAQLTCNAMLLEGVEKRIEEHLEASWHLTALADQAKVEIQSAVGTIKMLQNELARIGKEANTL